jgi:diacylglycerol kinase (CTP)
MALIRTSTLPYS